MTLNELTNNQKRKEFLDKYTGWNLWLAVPEISEKYYSYPLPDNTMIIVKETEHAKGMTGGRKTSAAAITVPQNTISWKVIGRDSQTAKRV